MRRIVSWYLLGVGLLTLILAGCKNPLVSGGILHFDQGRFERARETLLQAIEQEPQNFEAHFWLGKAYAELDSTEQARHYLDLAAELAGDLHPEQGEAVKNALEHYWSVRHNEGLSAANAAQKAREEDRLDEAQSNFRLALNQFKKARVYDTTREETPRNMGTVYFNLGQIDSGLVALRESHRLAEPGDDLAARYLFDQYRLLGDQAAGQRNAEGETDPAGLHDAVKFYTEAEELRPDDGDLFFSIGVVYYQLANVDSTTQIENMGKAVEYFEKTLGVSPDDQEALFNAASLHLEMKTCDRGVTLAKHLLDLDPKQGRYHDLVGRLNDCLGEKTERVAGLVFSRALRNGEVVPESEFRALLERVGAQSDLMRKYREDGVPEEVRTFVDPGGGEYVTWFYWTRGKAVAFHNGEMKYQTSFKPQQPAEEKNDD